MAHLIVRTAYTQLVDRFNKFPQGAPPADVLYRILHLLFREEEAGRVALLPITPFKAAEAAKRWKTTVADATNILSALASRGLMLDTDDNGKSVYTLPSPMAGFFEFSMMRVRQDIDQKLLAELFYQYLNVEEDFIKALFVNGETQLGRVYVNEEALWSHRAMAAVLGVVLGLPPIKQAMASRQMKSTYLEYLITHMRD